MPIAVPLLLTAAFHRKLLSARCLITEATRQSLPLMKCSATLQPFSFAAPGRDSPMILTALHHPAAL
ncbi:hypothetical protein ACVLD2_002353 [Paenibacillus sp. PvR052]